MDQADHTGRAIDLDQGAIWETVEQAVDAHHVRLAILAGHERTVAQMPHATSGDTGGHPHAPQLARCLRLRPGPYDPPPRVDHRWKDNLRRPEHV
ncbi:MAG: transposase [Myxococcota bacterium]|jgi:transposase